MKSWVILGILVAAFVLLLCLPENLEAKTSYAIKHNSKLTIKVPDLPYLNAHISGAELQFGIKSIILVTYVLLMTLCRMVLLKRIWRWC